jgi:hypothetical protein
VRIRALTLALCLVPGLTWSAEEPSLAERAAEANKTRKQPASPEKILTNDDLKKAKGNVIFLAATPTAVPTAEPVVPAIPDVSMGEQRERAARMRGSIEEAQRQLAESTPEQRTAILQRLKDALDELARAHEAIGALNERARQGAPHAPTSY